MNGEYRDGKGLGEERTWARCFVCLSCFRSCMLWPPITTSWPGCFKNQNTWCGHVIGAVLKSHQELLGNKPTLAESIEAWGVHGGEGNGSFPSLFLYLQSISIHFCLCWYFQGMSNNTWGKVAWRAGPQTKYNIIAKLEGRRSIVLFHESWFYSFNPLLHHRSL